jgi:hypothetical protein
LLQINDMDAIALCENIRLHTGIPLVGAVTEMDAAFQQRFHGYNSHFFSLQLGPGIAGPESLAGVTNPLRDA